MTAFEEMGIMAEIAKSLEEIDWILPTDIQAEAIPAILGGVDVLMAAETGSGKTGAFCLPVLQIVWETMHVKTKVVDKNADTWVLSPFDRGQDLSITQDGLSAQTTTQRWQGVRANKGVKKNPSKNRFYFEAHFTAPGLARVGWALGNGSLDLGTDQFSWGYGGTAKKSNCKNFLDYGAKFGDKFDVIGNILDLDAGTMSFSKNGTDLGVAFHLPRNLLEQNVFFPCVCIKNAALTVKFTDTKVAPFGCQWVGQLTVGQFVANSMSPGQQQKAPPNSPKAIILEPSYELAEQTHKCIMNFKKNLDGQVRQCLAVGGVTAQENVNQLNAGVDIVTGTIGRIQELINNGHLSVKACRFFIIDEVDAFLAQGNLQTILNMHALIPRMFADGKRLQMVVCSATLHNFEVKKLAERVMHFPQWIDLKGEDSVPDTVHHVVIRVDPRREDSWQSLRSHIVTDGVHARDQRTAGNDAGLSEAVKILKGEYVVKAIDTLKIDYAIIFCRTKVDCDNLENYLTSVGRARNIDYSCVCLHGDRPPNERTRNLETFKGKKVKFLICTDVAARGIDVKGIPFVLQVTLPDDKANYLHRIGRVGRAERMGLAVSFVANVPEKVWFHSNCRNRGKGCTNTRLTDQGGCCIWYNELQLLADIEEHLKCVIPEVATDFKIQVNEFDGKVVYGAKSTGAAYTYKDHVAQMANDVKQLYELESQSQQMYLSLYM